MNKIKIREKVLRYSIIFSVDLITDFEIILHSFLNTHKLKYKTKNDFKIPKTVFTMHGLRTKNKESTKFELIVVNKCARKTKINNYKEYRDFKI
ncbi:hypothetical protein BpHYR1_047877 [Brachionus plicatilis]|uniref:Uncharacterized protein n=1 Tax=Brachionus plicatilis TaxID=10195 RepID=A0A3M7T8L3_BRAPC|nr:hypothetical protein BpHYR1_047877 [Brachionus plicatilis]